MKLTVEINLGNDAMRTGGDVAAKLDQLADLIGGWNPLFEGHREILDRNGNTVGRWALTKT